jgi:diguanylate cyclase (GGDEF)-like protein/PAS domain S-box-containing protein
MDPASSQKDSDYRRLLEELREREAQLLFLAENVEDVIFRFRLRPKLAMEYVSAGVERLMGYSVDEYYAEPKLALKTVHPDDKALVDAMLGSPDGSMTPLIVRVVRKDGIVIWTEQRMRSLDAGDTLVGVARDITERVQLEEQLRMLALDDDLTGLRNRRGFIVFGNQLLSVLQRTGEPASLLFLDVDQLKRINDTEGHAAGDAALAEVGRAIRETFRESDVMARVGGDEFAVLLGAERAVGGGGGALARLQGQLDQRGGRAISVSGGLAHWDPLDPPSVERLMAEADRLMYRDKGRVALGDLPTPPAPVRRVLIVDDLSEMRLMIRLALEREDVEVVGEASDGAEAVGLAEVLEPDVVLLDLRMPGSDGFEAIPGLRAAVPDATIVVVTVLPPGPETDRALALGADHCLRKADLRAVVELVGSLG